MNKVKTLRNKADALLTPLIAALHPKCLLCGQPTQVAHHFVHKSKSTRLRYEISNLINLCHKCHQRLHHNESYEAGRIITLKGMVWFKKLERMKNEYVKADWVFYQANLDRLTSLIKSLPAL